MASLKRSAMTVLLLQISVVAVMVSGFHLDLDVDVVNPRGSCRQVDLSPCHAAVEGSQERPSKECCRLFQQIQDDECKCEAIMSDRLLGRSKYLEKALHLPEECGLSPPRGRECEWRRSSDPFLQLNNERESLKPCYMAVEDRQQPSEECCANLRVVPSYMRCKTIMEDEYLGQKRYREEASHLPEECGLPSCDLERRMAFHF